MRSSHREGRDVEPAGAVTSPFVLPQLGIFAQGTAAHLENPTKSGDRDHAATSDVRSGRQIAEHDPVASGA